MLSFIVRRLFQAALVIVIVSMLAFVLAHLVGDPVASILGLDASPEARAALSIKMHLNDPWIVQYGYSALSMLRGDFGMSYSAQQPVLQLFAVRVPATLELSGVALVMSLSVGIPLGVVAAIYRRSAWSNALMTSTVVGVSLPTFVVGIGLIYLFAVTLGWLPSFGRGTTVQVGGWTTGLLSVSGWKSILMPAVSLAVSQVALVARLVRTEMSGILRTDYIRFARARGIANTKVYFVHALRNALIPIITVSGIQLGYLIAFAVVVEQVFQWPGMGTLFLQALSQTDMPVISGFLVCVAVFFVTINLVVDFLYALADPRLRIRAAKAA